MKSDRIWQTFEVYSIYVCISPSLLRVMSKHLKSYIGGQVKTLRKQAELTQADLGEKIGRTAEAISNVETGKSLPSLDTLIAISESLSLPLTDFFPSGSVDLDRSANRLKAEAEAMAMLRGLSESQLSVALAQIKALREL